MSNQRFTVSELSQASQVSLASIKYYLREKLLPPGDPKAPHRAHYDERHLRRLRLIRALRELAGLPIATIAEIFAAVERGGSPFSVVASAMDAMRISETAHQTPMLDRARSDVRRLLKDMGVNTRADAGAVLDVAAALVKLRETWGDVSVEQLRPYAESARTLARLETEANREVFSQETETLLHTVVLGTILFEPVWLALRRVMHEDFAKTSLGPRRRKRAPKR